MTSFNLVHFSPRRHRRSRRWRSLDAIGLSAGLLLALPSQGLAQQTPDWGQWEEAAKGSDNAKPLPGIGYGGHAICEGYQLAGKHAYWRCMPRCHNSAVVGDFCLEAVSDAIYTCPDGKGFRQAEKIRYTNIRCGKKDWLITKRLADMYEETWQNRITDPTDDVASPSPPKTDDDQPTTTDGTKVTWGGGNPPWAPQEAEKKDDSKTDTKKSETAKTDVNKTDVNKTDDKKVTGGSTTTPSGSKKANRKEVQKSKTVARRSRGDDDYGQGGQRGDISPEAATAIGMGVMYGLGGFGGRGRMGGDRGMGGGGRTMDR